MGNKHSHSHSHGHGHSHGHSHGGDAHADMRDKMLAVEVSGTTCLLTAHLSAADGNELDIFFEDAKKKPWPTAATNFEAVVIVAGETHAVTFEPAPPEERPTGEVGCSHFVAKTPFLAKDAIVTVKGTVAVGGSALNIEWKNFSPAKYAHHED